MWKNTLSGPEWFSRPRMRPDARPAQPRKEGIRVSERVRHIRHRGFPVDHHLGNIHVVLKLLRVREVSVCVGGEGGWLTLTKRGALLAVPNARKRT
jgi:hypothetical protein